MTVAAKRQSWQDKVRLAKEFHKGMLRENSLWRIEDTAKELGYSTSTMCEYLLVADWIKTHPKIEKCRTFSDALEMVREKRQEMRLT